MFSALDAKVAGFKVYVVMDPSGDPSEIVRREQRLPVCQATTTVRSALAISEYAGPSSGYDLVFAVIHAP
jgi:hypothetical protein